MPKESHSEDLCASDILKLLEEIRQQLAQSILRCCPEDVTPRPESFRSLGEKLSSLGHTWNAELDKIEALNEAMRGSGVMAEFEEEILMLRQDFDPLNKELERIVPLLMMADNPVAHLYSQRKYFSSEELRTKSMAELMYILECRREELTQIQGGLVRLEDFRKFEDDSEKLMLQISKAIPQAQSLRRRLQIKKQTLDGNIRVICRVRPVVPNDKKMGNNGAESSAMKLLAGDKIEVTRCHGGRNKTDSFSFDKVFGPTHSQEDVFTEFAESLDCLFEGYNLCFFLYGQTGSGKTFTLVGSLGAADEGLLPRMTKLLYRQIQKYQGSGWQINATLGCFEIYDNKVVDLLDPLKIKDQKVGLKLGHANDPLVNLTRLGVWKAEDALRAVRGALKHRATGRNEINETSSRSHFVFTLTLKGLDESRRPFEAALSFADLAGTEDQNQAKATGKARQEAICINVELFGLRSLLKDVAAGNKVGRYKGQLPKLFHQLLEKSCIAFMVVNVSPCNGHINSSFHSLSFAKEVAECKLPRQN
ncbi:uncharacterized protein LOC135217895 [Macrobrachium nipponense]|uniref:uncharacterized protein LOC135217895 n=1 Tax=Macrobrachium nipponense TaxID=159736 RepID=UPI0030C841F0